MAIKMGTSEQEERETEFLRDIAAFEFAMKSEEIFRHLAKMGGIKRTAIIHRNTSPGMIALISSRYVNAFYSPIPTNYFFNLGDAFIYATPKGAYTGVMNDQLKGALEGRHKILEQELPAIPGEEVLKVFSLINRDVDPGIICEYLGGKAPSDLEGRVLDDGMNTTGLIKTDFLGAVAYLTRETEDNIESARQILGEKREISIVADLGDCLALPSSPVVYFALHKAAGMDTNIRIIAGPVAIAEEPLIKPGDFCGKQFELSDGQTVGVNAEGGIQISYNGNGNGKEPINLAFVQTANYLASLVPMGLPIDLAIFANLSLAGKEPDNFFANYNLGNLLLQDGRFEESAARLRKAQHALSKLGEPVVSFGEGTKQDRSHVEAVIRNNLGYAYMMTGRNDAALTEFEDAVELDPTTPFANNNMGTVYQIRGLYAPALSHYEKELRVNPHHSTAAASVGRVKMLQTSLN